MSDEAVKRRPGKVLDQLTAIYGAARMAALGDGLDAAGLRRMRELWDRQVLERFGSRVVAAALQRIVDERGDRPPPSLTEMVALCRECARGVAHPSHALVLPSPGQAYTDCEQARAQLARVKGMLASSVRRMPSVPLGDERSVFRGE